MDNGAACTNNNAEMNGSTSSAQQVPSAALAVQGLIEQLTSEFQSKLQGIFDLQFASVEQQVVAEPLASGESRAAGVVNRRNADRNISHMVVDNTGHTVGNVIDNNVMSADATGCMPNVRSSTTPTTNYYHTKLIELPKFSGDPLDWPLFERSFLDTTMEYGYSDVCNLNRLRQALVGEARDAVMSMLTFPDSINDIMKVLKETFGRPEQLINQQMSIIRKLNPIKYNDCQALIKFSNCLKNLTVFVKYAGAGYRLCDTSLLNDCLSKMPFEMQLQWAEYKESLAEYPSMEDLSNFLSAKAKRASSLQDTMPKQVDATRAQTLSKVKSHSASHMYVATRQSFSCKVCQGDCSALVNCGAFKDLSIDERWSKVKELQLCFSCLKSGHALLRCYSKKRCQIDDCGKRHHQLLHKKFESVTNAKVPNNGGGDKEMVFNGEARSIGSEVWFQILPVKIAANGRMISCFAFIDHGSSHSMLDRNVALQLGMTGEHDVLEMQWFNDVRVSHPTQRVSFEVGGIEHNCEMFKMTNIYTMEDMKLPTQTVQLDARLGSGKFKRFVHMNYVDAKPQLVIGLDYAALTTALAKPLPVNKEGAIAARTKLGWVVYGPGDGRKQCKFTGCAFKERDLGLGNIMKYFFEDEFVAASSHRNDLLSPDDKRALSIMEKYTVLKDRYEVKLLWKNDVVRFPPSYEHALRRLKGIENKCNKDAWFCGQYKAVINNYVQQGYARKLTTEEVAVVSNKTLYLPHFAVQNPYKQKLRVVFDAAAEIEGASLNNQLLAGPDLTTPLLAVLFKFRQRKIGVCADIKEMFLQVRVAKEDQCAQRFLWRDVNTALQPDVYVMTRMLFGAKCSPCLAQFVKNKNAMRFDNKFPRAVKSILQHHYVDDLVDSFEKIEEAIEVIKQVVDIHKEGGFELRNFTSNSKELLRTLREKPKGNCLVEMQERDIERVLGMYWDYNRDAFVFVLKFPKVKKAVLERLQKPTKREVLSFVMSIYDPFGILANLLLFGKLLMQNLWKENVTWDQKLPEKYWQRWQAWLINLSKVEQICEDRCYIDRNISVADKVEVHIFADASEMAMAAVAYLRVISADSVTVRFLFAKTRCAPMKYMSIPRLELQAALLAARMKEIIMANNDWAWVPVYFWTDSTTVLSWLNKPFRRYKQFVANRVGEILELSNACQWRWVQTSDNAADDATRASAQYNPEGRWLKGPAFLATDFDLTVSYEPQCDDENVLAEVRQVETIFVAHNSAVEEQLIEFKRFSSFVRLKRVLAWMLRFARNSQKKHVVNCKFLTAEEIDKSESVLCRYVQQIEFKNEYNNLSAGKPLSSSSPLISLNPVIDEGGVMRILGRIDKASCLSVNEKRQIILPKRHALTLLVAAYYHNKMRHLNRNTVVCELRRKFWVPSVRTLMKSIESNCNFCKLRKSIPRQPMMGLLPIDRITPYVRPFSYTGVDFFGPVSVKVRRSTEKRWVALFTCLTTRAVHLELAANLSSDACLLCIRNFINRRGIPVLMRSDNGTNFVGIDKELKDSNDFLDYDAIGEGVANLGIKWKFNCPANPSEGGAWERLVQSVKKVLTVILKEHSPKPETLISILIEAENIVNSRPLTHLPVDAEEEEPLTPNHFLLNTPNSTQTPAVYVENMCARKQWRIAQNIKNGFWSRWIKEYLPELTRRSKWCKNEAELKIGDLVLICDAMVPRSNWKRGRVVTLIKGADGIARSARVQTPQSVLQRPISKLAKLDVN